MEKNTFVTMFGKEPIHYISRENEIDKIYTDFNSASPLSQIYLITGIRGSGKTAFLTKTKRLFESNSEWICINLNPESNMIERLVGQLYEHPSTKRIFIKAEISVSIFGVVNGTIKNVAPITNMETALLKMMKVLKEKGKKVLLTIDEATNSSYMRYFVNEFQTLVREGYPVYAIMTGLYKNIYDLQNQDTLTFLYRAPKIEMEPFSNVAVANSFSEIFNLSIGEANRLADCVKGYAFAYQLFGSLYFENKNSMSNKQIYNIYAEKLAEFVYDKIWSELSQIDKNILLTMSKNLKNGSIKVEELITIYNKSKFSNKLNSSSFSVYRSRLIKEGLIVSKRFGYVSLSLPAFDDFVINYCIY